MKERENIVNEEIYNIVKMDNSISAEAPDEKKEKTENGYWTTSEIAKMIGCSRPTVIEMINKYYEILMPYIGKIGNRNIIYKPHGAEIFRKLYRLLNYGYTEKTEIETMLVSEVGEILSRNEPPDVKMKHFVELMERENRTYINNIIEEMRIIQTENNKALVRLLEEQIRSARENAETAQKNAETAQKTNENLKEELHNAEIGKIKLQCEKEIIEQKIHILEEQLEEKQKQLEEKQEQLEEKQKQLEKKSGFFGRFK